MKKYVVSNNKNRKEMIERYFLADLIECKDVFIVTGYSSIEYILHFLAKCKNTKVQKVRILIGNEFSPKDSDISDGNTLDDVIKSYWKTKGFKLTSAADVSDFIVEENGLDVKGQGRFAYLYESGHFEVDLRIVRDAGLVLHAKTFFLDGVAYNGSGNFSKNGLRYQLEIMTRHFDGDDYYAQLKTESEYFWSLGESYTEEFKVLINSVMDVHSDYKKTMGLIYSEFFEGEWFNDVSEGRIKEYFSDLWPWQKKTASEALYTLENNGSVIIAEPTGSGKTRVGAFIGRVLRDKLLLDKAFDNEVEISLICPTKVFDEWKAEMAKVNLKNINIIPASKVQQDEKKEYLPHIGHSHILIVDEAHEFRNMVTKKGQNLFKENNAIYTVLLSATPINRELSDFYGMICQIGADSMTKEDQRFMGKVFGDAKHSSDLDKKVVGKLKETIKEVTVRKTKKEINNIARASNKANRYPKALVGTYSLNFSDKDIIFVNQILELIDDLRGLAFLSKKGDYRNLPMKLKKSKGLARYYIIDRLRASKAALIEHIKGTVHAKQQMQSQVCIDIESDNAGTISSIRGMKSGDNRRGIFSAQYKDFFDSTGMEELKNHEIATYEKIYDLALNLSDAHVQSRVNKILEISEGCANQKLLVFDKSIITVKLLEALLVQKLKGYRTTVVYSLIGKNNQEANRNKIKKALGISAGDSEPQEHKNRRVIVVASNVLAESVNLQAASAILYSDVPLTPGNAEQREGRISRMNSPHSEISIWWPIPPIELVLNTDRTIARRYKTVQDALGSNINIPDFYEEFIEDYELEGDEAEDIVNHVLKNDDDTSGSVNDNAIAMQDSLYYSREYFKRFAEYYDPDVATKSKQSISFVASDEPWGLFFLSNDGFGVPDLVLIKGDNEVERSPEVIYCYLEKQLLEAQGFDISAISKTDTDRWLRYLSKMNAAVLSSNEAKRTKKEDALMRLLKTCLKMWDRQAGNEDGYSEIMENYRSQLGDRNLIRSWSQLIGSSRRKAAEQVLENVSGRGGKQYEFLTYNVQIRRQIGSEHPILPERLNEEFSQHSKIKMADTEVKAIILSVTKGNKV